MEKVSIYRNNGKTQLSDKNISAEGGSVSCVPSDIIEFLKSFKDQELTGPGTITSDVPKSLIKLMREILSTNLK